MSLSDKIIMFAFTNRFYAVYAIIALQIISYITKAAVDGFHLSKNGGRAYYYSSVCIAALSAIFFGMTGTAIRTAVFGLVLLYAMVSDAKTHRCADVVSLLLLVVAFIGVPVETALTGMFWGFIYWIVLLVISAVFPVFFNVDAIGGADIKFVAACTAVVGGKPSACAFLAALIIAVLVNSILHKKKQASEQRNTSGAFETDDAVAPATDPAKTGSECVADMKEMADAMPDSAESEGEPEKPELKKNADSYAMIPYIAVAYAVVYIIDLLFPQMQWLAFIG